MHRLIAGLVALSLAAIVTGTSSAQSFTEDFGTTVWRNGAVTTAVWDTVAGSIHLTPVPVTAVGGTSSSGAQRVLHAGDLAVVARGGSGVDFVDVSNPYAPGIVAVLPYGGFPPQVVEDVALAGSILYVSWSKQVSFFPPITDYAIDVYDVSNPASPVSVNTIALAPALGLTVHGNRLYAATGSSLAIRDITDATAPANLGGVSLTGTPQAVAVTGDVAFVAAGSAGLHVVDVSDPTAPAWLATRSVGGSAEGVDADGVLVAVAVGSSGVHFFDASTPSNPVLLGQWAGTQAHAVRLDGDVAVVADGTGGVVLLDIADPTSPVFVRSSSNAVDVVDVAPVGAFVYAAHTGGLTVYQAASMPPASLERSVTTGSTANPRSVRIEGDHAYVADGILRIYDASRTAPLVQQGTWGTAGVLAVDVDGRFAYVDALGTFTVLDVSNPASPTVLGTVVSGTGGSATRIVAHGSLVFVTYQFSGLYVFDVTDPSAPGLLDTYPAGAAMDVDVAGSHAYLADDNVGLRILDVSNPSALTLLGTFASTGVKAVVASGNYVFLGGGSGAHFPIETIDVSNPTAPVKVASVNIIPVRLSLHGHVLMSIGSLTTTFLDVSDPTSPAVVSSYTPTGTHISYDGRFHGDVAYLADWFSPSEGRLLELHVFDRGVVPTGNVAGSTTFASLPLPLGALRVTPTEQGTIAWTYSHDGGVHYTSVVADGTWRSAASGATADLQWKATLDVVPGQAEPRCSEVTIDWRATGALITSIADVPADQGGALRVDFTASSHELVGGTPVVQYQVLRRQGNAWYGVTVTPTGADAYSVVLPTVADSTLWDGPRYTVVKVHTEFTVGGLDSPVDSAYSVDNLAPTAPPIVSAAYNTGSGNQVQWTASPDADVLFYRIHRGDAPGFTVSFATAVDSVAGTAWTDPLWDGWDVYYAVEAVDSAGNASAPAYPGVTTAVEPGDRTPRAWALGQNEPNPMGSATVIPLAVPGEGGHVTLEIFDAAGRRVAALLDRRVAPGIHRVAWDGTDARGRRVPSGVYFCRLRTPAGPMTRKMTLLR